MTWGAVASIGVGLLTSQSSKGGGGGSTTQKMEMDPAMRPYIFGDSNNKGLLQYGQGLLQQSQSPERMQGWNNMMNRSQQLLGGSIAGNPFSKTGGYRGGTDFGALGQTGNGLGRYQPQAIPMAAPQQFQPTQNTGPSMEEIMAEWERMRWGQQNGMYGMGYGMHGFADGAAGPGIGPGSNSGNNGPSDAGPGE